MSENELKNAVFNQQIINLITSSGKSKIMDFLLFMSIDELKILVSNMIKYLTYIDYPEWIKYFL